MIRHFWKLVSLKAKNICIYTLKVTILYAFDNVKCPLIHYTSLSFSVLKIFFAWSFLNFSKFSRNNVRKIDDKNIYGSFEILWTIPVKVNILFSLWFRFFTHAFQSLADTTSSKSQKHVYIQPAKHNYPLLYRNESQKSTHCCICYTNGVTDVFQICISVYQKFSKNKCWVNKSDDVREIFVLKLFISWNKVIPYKDGDANFFAWEKS